MLFQLQEGADKSQQDREYSQIISWQVEEGDGFGLLCSNKMLQIAAFSEVSCEQSLNDIFSKTRWMIAPYFCSFVWWLWYKLWKSCSMSGESFPSELFIVVIPEPAIMQVNVFMFLQYVSLFFSFCCFYMQYNSTWCFIIEFNWWANSLDQMKAKKMITVSAVMFRKLALQCVESEYLKSKTIIIITKLPEWLLKSFLP